MYFHNTMKYYRERAGLTCQQLADILGLSVLMIKLYELGIRQPTLGIAVIISRKLGFVLTNITPFDMGEFVERSDRFDRTMELLTSELNVTDKELFNEEI